MKIEKIIYAGHSATFFEGREGVIAIDPWLAGNPICPNGLKTPKRIDLIILTHGHADHASEAPELAKRLRAKIVATWELAMIMGQEGVPEEQIVAMNKGGTVEFGELKVTLTNAYHSSSYDTKRGAMYAGEPCGIVIRDGQTSIYHAGDTCLFSDIGLIREMYQPHIALLPIGDRFTMGPKEAAQAAKLCGCRLAIPIHYATFPMLTGTADEFKTECQNYGIEVESLKPGGTFTL